MSWTPVTVPLAADDLDRLVDAWVDEQITEASAQFEANPEMARYAWRTALLEQVRPRLVARTREEIAKGLLDLASETAH